MSPLVRAKAFGMMDAGADNVAIAKELGVTRSAIWRLRGRREQLGEEKAVKGDFGKGGRKKVIGESEARWLRKAASDFPFDSANQLKARAPKNSPLHKVKTRRVREKLSKMGLAARRAAQKPLLTPRMLEKRLDWCRAHSHWKKEDWLQVEFSDESNFSQLRNVHQLVRRPVGQRFNPKFTVKTVKHPPSVMVWGCFDGKVGRGRLEFLAKGETMNSERYQATLQEKLLPIFKARKMDWFMQDGAPCHTSKSTRNFLEREQVGNGNFELN